MKTTEIKNPTQEQIILNLLKDNANIRVPLTDILALNIAQYNARIWSLKHKKKYNIINKIKMH